MPADFADQTDFENADRGLIARLEPGIITNPAGQVVFDADQFSSITRGECPQTVHPGLWRQSQLTALQGLYEVTPGIYQVRGADLSNMTLVESRTGVIVIDPLISQECAAAALALYRAHRGERPVTAVIYTHAHLDHFGGVLGVVAADTKVPIIAPEHFMEHAVSENVYAGTAMLRRGMYYSGDALPAGPEGSVGMGLGQRASHGTVGLIAPTLDITHTGQEKIIDGVRILFQLTPGTESPAEMNFYFPAQHALCLAENATRNMHNLLTLRGAQVRDPRVWSRYLAEAIDLYADDCEVAFASHHWPTWGRDSIRVFLQEQRDLYGYLHDQTVRLLNQGYTGTEAAELIEMPPGLDAAWHTHGYYGSASHNVKAIYQRYLGWYDGNPAHLWQHPPAAAAQRYARLAGGPDQLTARAREFLDEGDARFAAELASHAVFADPGSAGAREVLALALQRMGYGAENATWRNCFLMGALELREGIQPTTITASAGMASAMTVTQLFDTIAIRIDGPRAADTALSILWQFTDSGERYFMELSNGVLVHYPTLRSPDVDLALTLTQPQLPGVLASGSPDGIRAVGDAVVLKTLMTLTDEPDPDFAIVTP
jgi:alkyl sulfatase BDS1-like metallo-beta-lactamase superfamily hydrolase